MARTVMLSYSSVEAIARANDDHGRIVCVAVVMFATTSLKCAAAFSSSAIWAPTALAAFDWVSWAFVFFAVAFKKNHMPENRTIKRTAVVLTMSDHSETYDRNLRFRYVSSVPMGIRLMSVSSSRLMRPRCAAPYAAAYASSSSPPETTCSIPRCPTPL